MTLILDMAPKMETQLREEAAREGIEPEQYVLEAVKESLRWARQANVPPSLQHLEAGYRAQAAEEQRQAEAREWADKPRVKTRGSEKLTVQGT